MRADINGALVCAALVAFGSTACEYPAFSVYDGGPEPAPDAAPAPEGCATFRAELLLETDTAFSVLTGIDGDSALAGTRDGVLFRVHPDGTAVRLETPPPIDAPFMSAHHLGGGRIRLGDEIGRLWSARVDATGLRDLALVSTASGGESIEWLAGPPSPDEPLELYGLARQGGLLSWDAQSGWRERYRFRQEGPGDKGVGGLAWIERGSVFAVKSTAESVIRLERDVLVEEAAGAGAGGVTTVAKIAGHGVVLAGSRGLFRRNPETREWVRYDDQPNLLLYAVTPYEDGFVFAGTVGFFGQYRPSTGFCRPEQFGSSSVFTIARLGRNLLLGGKKQPDSGREVRLTFLRRVD